MKKTIIKIIFGFIVLPAALVGTFYYLNQNGFFDIKNIDVTLEGAVNGQEPFLKPNIEKLKSTLSKYKGQSLWNIKLDGITKDLAGFDWVESTKMNRAWPATLSIKLKPYEVKFLFVNKNGKLLPIIKDGSFLEAVDPKQAPDVMLLEGDIFVSQVELRQQAVGVIDQIPMVGSFSKKTISEVGFDDKEGFWMTMVKTGIRVKIGDDQVAIKAARVGQVVDYLNDHQFEARVIDANLSKKVLVRLRKAP